MADISIVKIKVRRGTDSDRRRVILDEGELGFTTDTQRFFVGDGGTLGGINIANKFIGTGLRTNYGDSLLGDFVYDTSENALFALTSFPPSLSSNWVNVGNRSDDTTIELTTAYKFGVKPKGLGVREIRAGDLIYLGLSASPNDQITINLDNNTIKFNPTGKIYADTSVVSVTALKSTPFGVDWQNIRVDNLPVFAGLSALNTSNYNWNVLPSKSLLIVNEPYPSKFYYVMIKSP